MLGYGYYFDPTYFLVIIGAVLSIWASARVNNTFSKYSRVRSMTGMTGAEAARMILNYNGLGDVQVEHVSGSLTIIMTPGQECCGFRIPPMPPEAWRQSAWRLTNAAMRCSIRKVMCR